jgi:hypothetical protein
VERHAWASDVVDRLAMDVSIFVDAGWLVPEPFPLSRWSHHYQCSQCSTGLDWNYRKPHEHHCPNCGNVETDDLYHACWITLLNLNQITAANTMVTLAKAGRMPDGHSRASELLIGYAQQYHTYREHGKNAGTGKLQPQSLDEAVWMLQATDLYEELCSADSLNPDERAFIADNLFAPAIPLLKRHTRGVHNIQTWMACAIASMALATQDEESLQFAERIVQKNAAEGLLPSGLWYEISPGYHYYTLQAFLSYAKSMLHYGRESGIENAIRAMLVAPLSMVLSDGHFAAINDSSDRSMTNYGAVYEKASGLLDGSDAALSMLCNKWGYQRDNMEALLYGPTEICAFPKARAPLTITEGMASMQKTKTEVLFKCTSPAGGHDHPDRLTLNLYVPGRSIRAADLGSVGYSNPIHGEFLKRTESHNTVMVDGLQQPIVSTQRISKSYDVGEALVVTGHYNQAYPGVRFWRTIVLGDGWCLDWTSCSSEDEHLYQWLFHVNAAICDEAGKPLVVDGETDALIDNIHCRRQRIIGQNTFRGSWIHTTGDILKVDARLQAKSPGEVGVFESPDLPTTQSRNALLMQSKGKAFDLVTLFSLNDTPLPSYAIEADTVAFCLQDTAFVLDKTGFIEPKPNAEC